MVTLRLESATLPDLDTDCLKKVADDAVRSYEDSIRNTSETLKLLTVGNNVDVANKSYTVTDALWRYPSVCYWGLVGINQNVHNRLQAYQNVINERMTQSIWQGISMIPKPIIVDCVKTVSYTHLDVYKRQGFECGFVVDGFSDWQVDDQAECYALKTEKVPQ